MLADLGSFAWCDVCSLPIAVARCQEKTHPGEPTGDAVRRWPPLLCRGCLHLMQQSVACRATRANPEPRR